MPSHIKGLLARLRAIFSAAQASNELDAELAFHLDQLAARYEGQGIAPSEARRRARLELGSTTTIHEEVRDRSGANWLTDAQRDLSLALRNFRKSPGFALAAILTLALGIGVNIALFTILYSVAYRPLPVSEPGSLSNIYLHRTGGGDENRSSYGSSYFESFAEFSFMQQHARTASLAGLAEAEMGSGGLSVKSLHAQLVSSNLLQMMGAYPVLGRFFLPDETAHPGSAPAAVLSHATWRSRFQSDPDIVGKSVTLNRTPFTIIGVADPDSRGPLVIIPDIWIPLSMEALTRPGESMVDDPNAGFVQIFARPRNNASTRQIAAEMSVLGQQAHAAHGSKARVAALVVPAAFMNYPDVMDSAVPVFGIIGIAGSLILLMACANVANLLLARSLSRRREIAIRLSLGAGRFRLLRQMLTESLLLSLAGAAAGLVIVWRGGALALSFVPADAGHLQLSTIPDTRILVFAILIAVLSAAAFGLLPAFHSLRLDLTPSLKSEGLINTGQARVHRTWLQNTLVGIQVAVSVILLASAGLLTQAFRRASELDTGRNMHGLLIASFDFRQQQYTAARAQRFHEGISRRLVAVPGVDAVASSLLQPEMDFNTREVRVFDPGGARGVPIRSNFDEVSADYLRTAGMRLLAGRTFTPAEASLGDRVVVIDQNLARKAFTRDPLGRYLSLSGEAGEQYRVIGVVTNTRSIAFGREPYPSYFVPMRGLRFIEGKLWLRYRGSVTAASAALREAASFDDPDISPSLRTIEENVELALMPVRLASWTTAAIGILAILVAAIGLYGIISFAVTRRLREMGIRIALGADSGNILSLVFGQLPGPVGIGAGIGLVIAIAGGYLIRSLLYGVSPFEWRALAPAAIILTLVCCAACWIPARRALTVDPATVLRND